MMYGVPMYVFVVFDFDSGFLPIRVVFMLFLSNPSTPSCRVNVWVYNHIYYIILYYTILYYTIL